MFSTQSGMMFCYFDHLLTVNKQVILKSLKASPFSVKYVSCSTTSSTNATYFVSGPNKRKDINLHMKKSPINNRKKALQRRRRVSSIEAV